MALEQIDVTGSRLVGAITKELGFEGPKHHAVILGRKFLEATIYIAELMNDGYQISTYEDFCFRYEANGSIRIEPNVGSKTNVEVANDALAYMRETSHVKYHVANNNCESFVNQIMLGNSRSTQVVNTALGLVLIVGLYFIVKNANARG